MKPAFPYPGGKTKLLKRILPFVPASCATYVEPFAGGLAVMLARPMQNDCREVANDISENLISFYRHAKTTPLALIETLRGYLHSRADFCSLVARDAHTQLGVASTWYFLQEASFGGKGLRYGRGSGSFSGFDSASAERRILELHDRIKDVIFRCQDAVDVIREFDSPDTFFFCDPPYIACADTAYKPFLEEDMARLRDALASCKGKWLLTCDDSPATRRVFSGFHVRQNEIKYTLSKTKTGKVSNELLVFSPSLAAEFPKDTCIIFSPPHSDNLLNFQTSQITKKTAS